MATQSPNIDYQAELDVLKQIGPRLTGSEQHNQLIDHIETRLKNIGYDVHSDPFSFQYMPPFTSPATLKIGDESIHISSVFPYSGFTAPEGITGKLVRLRGPLHRWSSARDQIAVVALTNPPVPFSALVSVWDGSAPWGPENAPLLPATLLGASIAKARAAGVRAVVVAWDAASMSPAAAANQYLPFTMAYQDLPVVFVAGTASARVLEAAADETATLTLPSPGLRQASSRSVWAVAEGEEPGETVLVVTHTDGVNVVEENGHVGVLQLAQDARAKKPRRTHVFVFVSGHMRIPAVSEHGQATSKWLRDHPEWWRDERKAVAALVIEHLGAMEYVDDPARGTLERTGKPVPELLYANTPQLAALLGTEWTGMEAAPGQTRISRPSAYIQFGEGEPLAQAGIPNVALVTAPIYLLAAWEGDEGELIELAGLTRQIDSFRRLREHIDELDTAALGSPVAAGPIQYFTQGITLALAAAKTFLGRQ
ncbi:hypothetical protein ISF_05607 [Cordyceps fumosorosea ARSEF 2679]|uniref:PA domain-containing protein n=1 Tax=Cordyceps fumosorosea (strain ARSEF 2679) TaxID=1081104 RepID=A0A167UF91_CORFA|nr:hypothetical protein ISF_05607 [Cordyceps fumosorosea ARSEF 2679]OAA61528.1 hypothetical protein ISF_05607 [Cordyceps fumosorosea ARSEF 2679]